MANSEWSTEDAYWRMNYHNRPYASAGTNKYDFYQPGYRYGYESANRYAGRAWNEVEADLKSGWNSFEHRSKSWEGCRCVAIVAAILPPGAETTALLTKPPAPLRAARSLRRAAGCRGLRRVRAP